MKNLRNYIQVFILLLSVLVYSCNHRCIRGNGTISTEQRSVEGFDKIEVSSTLKVIYTREPVYSVKIEADENLIGYITTEVIGGELKIGIRNGKCFNKITKGNVYVSSPTLNSVEVSGASEFTTVNSLSDGLLGINLSGASRISMGGSFTQVNASLSGSSSLSLVGIANGLSINSSGASYFNGTNFSCTSVSVDFSGASDGSVNVSNTLVAKLSGASSLDYYGSPTVSSDLSGSSSITKK